MELPPALRSAVDAALEGVALSDLQHAAAQLSRRYRAETRDGRLHLDGALAVRAYLAARLPATYAAVRTSFGAVQSALPDFAPTTMLDVGAGPGTALWAARDSWSTLADATLIEISGDARRVGIELAGQSQRIRTRWIDADAVTGLRSADPADLISMAYVLDELSPDDVPALIDGLWALTRNTLVIVEPGTPAGWKRILAVRSQLIEAGASIVAPCPHAHSCPLITPDWCHFSRKVARSRLHRLTKGAEVPWEDEKFIYIAASRSRATLSGARVIAPPRRASGQVRLKLCRSDGVASETLLTKRDGPLFRAARRADWGDTV